MRIDEFLSLLRGVRQVGPGRWTALCPGHDDHSPSLSVREGRDGVILIRCWSRCTSEEVVAALGLTMADLFPDSGRYVRGRKRPKQSPEDIAIRELADRFDQACINAHRRLAVLYRTVGWIFVTYNLDVTLEEAEWIQAMPFMECVLDWLLLGDAEEKLAGLRAVQRWLV